MQTPENLIVWESIHVIFVFLEYVQFLLSFINHPFFTGKNTKAADTDGRNVPNVLRAYLYNYIQLSFMIDILGLWITSSSVKNLETFAMRNKLLLSRIQKNRTSSSNQTWGKKYFLQYEATLQPIETMQQFQPLIVVFISDF